MPILKITNKGIVPTTHTLMALKYSSVAHVNEEVKPRLRGHFHLASFYIFILVGMGVFWRMRRFDWSYLVYMASLLAVYGTSGAFHVIQWKSKAVEVFMQQLDHANIFLLIAGTYTPICVRCLPFEEEPWVRHILIAAWSIAIAGVIKCVVWHNPPKILNVAFYSFCGLTIMPFMPKIVHIVHPALSASFLVGGLIYLVGGIIYGVEYPDPYPDVFGYHEIFHICTILANLCFFIPIIYCSNSNL